MTRLSPPRPLLRPGLVGCAGLLAVAAALAGCSDQLGDRSMDEDVRIVDLDAVQVFRNIDGFPNVARVCADGVAFAVTSTESGPGMVRVPEWDAVCPSGDS